MITERFTADILADIKDFQRKMKEVDKTIRKAALGVTIPVDMDASDFNRGAAEVNTLISQLSNDVEVNVNGDISDLQRAVAEAQSSITALNNEVTVNINGDHSDFNNSANDVQRQTSRLSRKITEARIGADIGAFETRMVEVMRALTDAGDTVTPQIELEMNDFMRDMSAVQERMREIARSTTNPQVEADIAGFMAQMALVQAELNDVVETHDVDIRLDSGGFMAEIARIRLQLRSLTARDFVVKIRSAWSNYQAIMGAMASFSRNFGEIVGMTSRGIMISMSPAIVPVLASVVGLLGQLGPMIGVLAGSTFALVTSFGLAGIGAAGFAAVAIPSIGKVIETSTELKELEEKIAKADTWEKRNKLMKEQAEILNNMSKEQAAAGKALTEFKDNYSALVKDMEKPVLGVFASGLTAITTIFNLARPMIENVTKAVQSLMDTFNKNLEATDVKDFFTFLSTNAAPALTAISKAVGNFVMGLFNMMTAFGPLSTETQNSFLAMSESFRSWTDGLSESKKFQAFVDYVRENMPKIRSIFSDAFQGIINTFAAFAPSSADMMSGLQDMMERFKEWSAALGESQGFKNFIDYIQTNGPVVISTIGEIVDFIINLGKAAAPIGEQMLGMINGMIDFANGMLEAHPWLGKIAIGMVVLGGAFMAALPTIALLNGLLGGLITKLILYVAKQTWAAITTVAKWVWMGTQALLQAARMAAAWFIALGPIGWVSAAIIALVVLVIANWDKVKEWTIKAWTAISTFVKESADKILGWIQEKFPKVYEVIKSAMENAKIIISAVWDAVKATFKNVLAFLKALVKGDFEGMKQAVSNQMNNMKSMISTIWNAIKAHFSNILSFLVSTVGAKFLAIVSSAREKMNSAKTVISSAWDSIKSAASSKLASLVTSVVSFFTRLVSSVRTKMTEAVTTVGRKVGEMPGKVLSFVGKMLSAGKDLVGGLITGIKNMAGSAIEAISGVVGGVIGKAKSLLKIKSPSRIFSEMGGFISEGLAIGVDNDAKMAIQSVSNMAAGMTAAFSPQLAMAGVDVSLNKIDTQSQMDVLKRQIKQELSVDMSVNHNGTGQLDNGRAEESQDIVLMIDGYELARIQRGHLDRMNGNRLNLASAMRG